MFDFVEKKPRKPYVYNFNKIKTSDAPENGISARITDDNATLTIISMS
jgi:hypothetical protein